MTVTIMSLWMEIQKHPFSQSSKYFWWNILHTESMMVEKVPEFSAESLYLRQGMATSGRWCHMTLLDHVTPVGGWHYLCESPDGHKYWTKRQEPPVTRFVDDDGWDVFRPPYHQAKSSDIEMTAYVLMTYTQLGLISEAIPIMKWLLSQRNANGGFSSTQVWH